MWFRRILKALLITLISFFGLLLLLFVILNLPFSHRFISEKVNAILVSANLPVEIRSIETVLPGKVFAEGVIIRGEANDTIIYAGTLKADFKTFALLRNKVIIKSAELNNLTVSILRNRTSGGLNIAEAFSHGRKEKETIPETKKKSWDVTVFKADISGITFRMTDSSGGINIDEHIDKIVVEADKMSLVEKTISIRSLGIKGATGTIKTNHIDQEQANTDNSTGWNFGLLELNAKDLNQVFEDSGSKFKLDLISGEVNIETGKIDLISKIIEFKNISVIRTNVIFNSNIKSDKNKELKGPKNFAFPWDIRGDEINLQEVACSLYSFSDSTGHHPISNLMLSGLSMKLTDLIMSNVCQKADIQNLGFDFGNGFSLKKLKATLDSQSDKVKIDIDAETAGTILSLKASAEGNLISIINNPSELISGKIVVSKSSISLNDLLYFKPDLQTDPVMNFLSAKEVNFNGEIDIDGTTLAMRDFSISQLSDFGISLNCNIKNIFHPKNIAGDLQFIISKLDNKWAKDFLNVIKPGISFPEYKLLTVKGTLSDSLVSPGFTLNIKSDLGNMDLSGSFDSERDMFSVKTEFNNLRMGKITGNEILGSLSGSAIINGTGIKNKNISADAAVLVDSIYFNRYTYTNSKIDCNIRNEKYGIKIFINDPFLSMNLNADVNMSDSLRSGRLDCSYTADLKKLNLFKDTINISGKLTSDFSMNRDKIRLNLLLPSINLKTPGYKTYIENINVSFETDSLSSKLSANSDFLNTQIFIGKPVSDLGLFIKDYTAYLKSFADPKHQNSMNQIFSFPAMNGQINLKYIDAFKVFIPDTSLIFRNIFCSVNTGETGNRIKYTVNLDDIRYRKIVIKKLKVTLSDSTSVMDLSVNADTCLINFQPVNKISLSSHFANWQSLTRLSAFDKNSMMIYDFELKSNNDTSNIYLTIPSKQIILNGYKWQMDSPDLIKINRKTGTVSPAFETHTDSSSIKINEIKKDGLQSLNLEMKNVWLGTIYRTEMVSGKPSGNISGSTVISIDEKKAKKIDTNMQFRDVSWSDLNFKQITLNGFLSSEKPDAYSFDITSRLDTSEISIKGEKTFTGKRDIDIRFNSVPVNSVQPFVKEFLSDLKGYVSGNFNLSTKENIESLAGEMKIKDVNLRINSLNSSYRMTDDIIRFSGKKMTLKNFKVLDSLSHELNIDGSIDFRNKESVLSDIEISTSDLQVMNRKEDKKSSFYGVIFVDARLSVKGPVTSPVLKGKVTLTKGTDIYFRQQDNLSLSESEKVLTFVSSKSTSEQNENRSGAGKNIINRTSIESIVQIDPATRISIDLSTRMFNIGMVIKGGGDLNYNMLVNKQVNLSGKYEVSEGSADLKMIGWPNKAFSISKGGFIRWDGKLNDPELKLEAINKVTSSYVNPVDNKERYVNFDVTLKLSNRLSAMDILFTINTTDQYLMSIINTLSPEEQMRQAITILLFENVDLPGISTTSNYVSEQVNQMVASQLNALTKTTIKGIDISFGIDSYVQANASGGQETKTSLSYEVKRKLMNDRAQIQLSGRINDGSTQSKSTEYSLNNVSFEYRLDSAGTKFLKVYNEHTYEDVFEGEVIKTGIGLTYRKNYPALSDIWRKDEEKKRRRDEVKK
jgi:translocation and assembly module TamB